MVGILSYGAYIPMWRISRDEIARASGGPTMGGERSAAFLDEDSLTMAVEAGIDCLTDIDPKEVDGIFFATITSPLKEKHAAAIIASTLDLKRDVLTADFTDTLRAGTMAVRAAMDAVKAGTAKKVLVTVADSRMATPTSDLEQIFGDGAAALLVGENGTIADIEGFSTLINPVPGPWRREVDVFPKRFEAKMDIGYGFMKDVPAAVGELAKKLGVTPKDVSKVAYFAPDPRSYLGVSKGLGIDKTQLQDPLFSTVGITGTPHCLLLLVAALETAKPGEKILCASHGEGSDAFLVKTTDRIEEIKGKRRGVSAYVKSKRMLPSYGRFADIKKIRYTGWPIEWEKPRDPVVKYWRDEKSILPLYGMKCKKCGEISYPIARCCMYCGEKDNYEEVKLAKKGKVFSYTHDYLIGPGNVQPADGINPSTKVIVDLEDGCRMLMDMVDHELKEVGIDMTVELAFRLWNEKADFRHYGWKVRPVRG